VRTGHDGAGAWVEVADDGPGMPPEIQDRIFEPLFTTKPEGTGLGLAMVYAFVLRHGGRIAVETASGRGTSIRMWFPAGGEGAVRAAVPDHARRVLVVEDDHSARQALQTLLEEEGFTVAAAGTGEEALARLASFEPDALVVDLRLPGIDGVAVARTAREQRPSLAVVIMSGMDASDRALTTILRDPLTAHIGKPVDFDRLVNLLRTGPSSAAAIDSEE